MQEPDQVRIIKMSKENSRARGHEKNKNDYLYVVLCQKVPSFRAVRTRFPRLYGAPAFRNGTMLLNLVVITVVSHPEQAPT